MVNVTRLAYRAALGCAVFLTVQSGGVGWAGCPKGYRAFSGCVCAPNVMQFGYFRTQWRQWPGEPRPDITFPQSLGREVLPTPPGQKLPPGAVPELLQPERPRPSGLPDQPPLQRIPLPEGGLPYDGVIPGLPEEGPAVEPGAETIPPGVPPTAPQEGAPPTGPPSILPGLPGEPAAEPPATPPASPDVSAAPRNTTPPALQLPPSTARSRQARPPQLGPQVVAAAPAEHPEHRRPSVLPAPSAPAPVAPLRQTTQPAEPELPAAAAVAAMDEPPADPPQNGPSANQNQLPGEQPKLAASHTAGASGVANGPQMGAVAPASHSPPSPDEAPVEPRPLLAQAKPQQQTAVPGSLAELPLLVEPESALQPASPDAPARTESAASEGSKIERSAAKPRPKPLQANWMAALNPGFRGGVGRAAPVRTSTAPIGPMLRQPAAGPQPIPTVKQTKLPFPEVQPTSHMVHTRQADAPLVAFDGYCPVELLENERWVAGNPGQMVVHQGRTYLLAGPTQRRRFQADPDRYAPACSGCDPVLKVEGGRQVPGQTEYCATFGGRLYMFSSSVTMARFRSNPRRYTAALEK